MTEKKLVESLRDVIDKAKNVIDSVEENDKKKDNSRQETLHSLYPSTKGKEKKRSIPFFSSSSSTSKKWKLKKKYSSQVKVTECLKDIFFLLHNVSKVPRKNAREFYYENNLVACAVKLNSTMGEVAVRDLIRQNFPVIFEKNPLIDFSFVRAVGDIFVWPSNIVEWDYKTIKHVYSTGPIYVRSDGKVPGFEDEEDANDVLLSDDLELQIGSHSKTGIDEAIPGCSRKIDTKDDSIPEKLVSCPVCHKRYPSNLVEAHASGCAEKRYDFMEYSSDDIQDDVYDGE